MSDEAYEGLVAWRRLGGREGVVIPLTFGRARLHVRRPGAMHYDDGW